MTTYLELGSCGLRGGSADQGTFLKILPLLFISTETLRTEDLDIGLVLSNHCRRIALLVLLTISIAILKTKDLEAMTIIWLDNCYHHVHDFLHYLPCHNILVTMKSMF